VRLANLNLTLDAIRRYEQAMHRFFRDVRVHKRKEFFAATADDVHRFFDMVASGDDEEYGERWRALVGVVGSGSGC